MLRSLIGFCEWFEQLELHPTASLTLLASTQVRRNSRRRPSTRFVLLLLAPPLPSPPLFELTNLYPLFLSIHLPPHCLFRPSLVSAAPSLFPSSPSPPDRTGELRRLGFPSRHLGPIQMTTDTALGVTKIVVQDGSEFSSLLASVAVARLV